MGSMEDESVQALVLHGAKDLRIVCLSINEVLSTDKTRKKEHHNLRSLDQYRYL